LSILRNARLIDSRKQGRWMYYRLADEHPCDLVKDTLAWLFRSIQEAAIICQDDQKMESIREKGPQWCAETAAGLETTQVVERKADSCQNAGLSV
jgi:DNA-binding transcriptional ArsR family regulator